MDSDEVRFRRSSPIVPEFELAAQLDRHVDRLTTMSTAQRDSRCGEQYVDLLVGLAQAAQALRSSVRGDVVEGERVLRSSLGNVTGADFDALVFP
ncbi:hypothetical protein [Lentzea sp. NBRC 102530]|uniref:hypothetical protein n=1 Tax=Lentzea sp. NBRC 102530 TaxID=3032201 RepID=UPI0024A08F5E|nr:hypothetical protein [Lentzea sp. NBRC 102530]GLY46831.1 hypothetical protein Lesp01_04870 [Lentzea sp. NBRC 102530]